MTHPDSAVGPEARGRGLFREALRYMEGDRRPPHDLNLRDAMAHRSVRHIEAEISRPVSNQVRTFVNVLDAAGMRDDDRWGLTSWQRVAAAAALPVLQRLGRRRPLAQPEDTIRDVATFDRRADALFEVVMSMFEAMVERDAAYLNWRYLAPGSGPFEVRAWEERGEWVGYSVVRRDPRRWEIAELLVAPARPEVVEGLVGDVVRRARQAGASAVSLWLPVRHPYTVALRRHGFFGVPPRRGLVYRPGDAGPDLLAPLDRRDARLHFTIGDTDLV